MFKMPKQLLSLLLASFSAALFSQVAALAQTAPTASPPAAPATRLEEPDTLILSDRLDYDDTKKESIFTGKVMVTRGLMTLSADRLVMREDAQGFQHGTATVSTTPLVVVRQENPEKFETIIAQGLRAEYNSKAEEIDLINQATVTKYVCGKPFDTISGERIKYNQRTNTYQAVGGAQSASVDGRVRSLSAPNARAQAAFEACQKEQAAQQLQSQTLSQPPAQ